MISDFEKSLVLDDGGMCSTTFIQDRDKTVDFDLPYVSEDIDVVDDLEFGDCVAADDDDCSDDDEVDQETQNGKFLPLIYAVLPDKKQETYMKFFNIMVFINTYDQVNSIGKVKFYFTENFT
ncbi:hypothetical protein BpHYR1_052573 [Brachionus plicatilis]|uniref:Uncharacterized protein n=1 Tax=Brachionus plicatilis TaxID=10195 RepID=A0A3M7QU57_BRAPC|nr:hypothetical protein BpHYR1_052573 [Brachionus plicatilis]